MKIGYHYTSYKNWLKIKEEGLLPKTCQNDSLADLFPKGVMGFWVWQNDLKGNSHIGTIIHRVQSKRNKRIVKLRLKYSDTDTLRYKGDKIILFHAGVIGKWTYHLKEPAVIITKRIDPKNIELVSDYNLNKLLK